MNISCGLIGRPNAGKSTLFKVLTSVPVEIAPYPFSTISPNIGVAPIPDRRLTELSRWARSSKTTYCGLKIVDVAGLVRGASKGEGLGNQFLAQVREMDLLIHVIGSHDLNSKENGARLVDRAGEVNIELALADLATVEKRLSKVSPQAKAGERAALAEQELLERLHSHLNRARPARSFHRTGKEDEIIKTLHLLTDKKVLYVLNQSETDLDGNIPVALKKFARQEGAHLISVCAKLELELSELDDEGERLEFQKEYHLGDHASLEMIVKECYRLLELITFFTIKGEEARAWIVKIGTTALEAAGRIHSDMRKGFRSVEVIPWEMLVKAESLSAAREKGWVRVEGKSYAVKEGDVLFVRFTG